MKKSLAILLSLALVISLFAMVGSSTSAATIKDVVLVGNLQSEFGQPGDWQPELDGSKTKMVSTDGKIYRFTGLLPAGDYEYKVALGGSWTENYGSNFKQDGPNYTYSSGLNRVVSFFYNDKTKEVTLSKHVTLVGNLQAALAGGNDWSPESESTQMTTVDGENYFFVGTLPAGSYEFKVALGGSWSENYGADGVKDGGNIAITQESAGKVVFAYNDKTKKITYGKQVALVGDIQTAIGDTGVWNPETGVTVMLPNGDGTYSYQSAINAGTYEYKVALSGGWGENYGANGASGGDNLKLTLASDDIYKFTYNDSTHLITAERVITKQIPAHRVAFAYKNITLLKGFKYKTSLVFKPYNVTDLSAEYVSLNPSVATVDAKGVITAVGKGTAKIKVKHVSKHTALMSVTVR